MSEATHRVSPELVAALLAIEPLTARLHSATLARPGSPAAKDARVRVGRHAHELATASLSMGVEHLEAWRLLAFEAHVLPPFVYLTLLRAGIEGAGQGPLAARAWHYARCTPLPRARSSMGGLR